MKNFFTSHSYKHSKKLTLLGGFLFSIFFIIICYGVRFSTKKQIDQKNYILLKEASSQLFSFSKMPSSTTTTMIENALKKYPKLSKEYQSLLTNLYLIQGHKEKALELLNEPTKIKPLFEEEIIRINNEVTRLYLENNLEKALEQASFLQSLLDKNKENFPMLFSLNLFRLFLIANKLNVKDKVSYIQEINNNHTCNEIFKLFSEGECTIKKFLKM